MDTGLIKILPGYAFRAKRLGAKGLLLPSQNESFTDRDNAEKSIWTAYLFDYTSVNLPQLTNVDVEFPPTVTLSAPGSLLLDTYPSAAAYSLRKVRTAYAGSAIRIRRSSDNTEQDIGFSGGDLDTAAITSFVGANDGFVTTFYDQSGNSRDLTQATATKQPIIVTAGTIETNSGKPKLRFDGARTMRTSNGVLNSSALTTFAAMQSSAGAKVMFGLPQAAAIHTSPFFRYAIFHNNGQYGLWFNGNSYDYSTPSTAYSLFTLNSANTTNLCVNGVVVRSNINATITYPNSVPFIVGSNAADGELLNGNVYEIIVYLSDQEANRSAIEANINSYYSIYSSGLSLSPSLLTNSSTLFAPVVTPQAVSLTLPLLTNASTLFAPVVTPQAVSLTLPLLTNASSLFAPVVTPQPVNITLPVLTNSSTLFAPTIQAGSLLLMPALNNSNTLYQPTLLPQPVGISLPLVSNSSTLYSPAIFPKQALSLPSFTNGNAVFAPQISVSSVSVVLPRITNTSALYPFRLEPQPVDLSLAFIDSSGQLFLPVITPVSVNVSLPVIANTSEQYPPFVGSLFQFLEMPVINSGAALYPPIIGYNSFVFITAPSRIGTSSSNSSSISQTITFKSLIS